MDSQGPLFHDCPGFAAFSGCYDISKYIHSKDCILEELTYLLECTVLGLMDSVRSPEQLPRCYMTCEVLLRQGADPNSTLHLWSTRHYTNSTWSFLFRAALFIIVRDYHHIRSRRRNKIASRLKIWSSTVDSFLVNHADVDSTIISHSIVHCHNGQILYELEESPLACLKRFIPSGLAPISTEAEDLLQVRGAADQKRCSKVSLSDDKNPPTDYQVSEALSNRLFEIWDPTEQSSLDACERCFEELITSLANEAPLD